MKTDLPLVSVVCLCYNQGQFVEEAIHSVLSQDYDNLELIVVDDGSTDNSVEVIRRITEDNPKILLIINDRNLGNCKAFNRGFQASRGDYIIDLAADDILEPGRVSLGVSDLEQRPQSFGVQYGDVTLIDEQGKELENFYDRKHLHPESGEVFLKLITTFFISAPSMFIRREVLEKLNGYDESLAYEDFDFWIRSSRRYLYTFTPTVTVKKRIHSNNFSRQQRQWRNRLGQSTYQVCCKILDLAESNAELNALIRRCRYEIRQSTLHGRPALVLRYVGLIRRVWKKLKVIKGANS